ncbi:hypothetical protein RCL_jg4785.t1 [Rhizophagus clarus]|uniref:Uncharacterized protein n=1 Tax=Rhizophagus clarus TaxID=94130 RepID=A0A8H3R6K9_9GLOM|nr:hypothetical protein RCL_jg4785.t1 [Rhizophagus clarus]
MVFYNEDEEILEGWELIKGEVEIFKENETEESKISEENNDKNKMEIENEIEQKQIQIMKILKRIMKKKEKFDSSKMHKLENKYKMNTSRRNYILQIYFKIVIWKERLYLLKQR